jgi:hypothetical protein
MRVVGKLGRRLRELMRDLGARGGKTTASNRTPAERSETARKAVLARGNKAGRDPGESARTRPESPSRTPGKEANEAMKLGKVVIGKVQGSVGTARAGRYSDHEGHNEAR